MAKLTKNPRELLSKKSNWLWGPNQDEAFKKIKLELASPPVLNWYDPTADTMIAADASSYGLGAVLLQRQKGEWKPATYAFRSLRQTKTRYACKSRRDKQKHATPAKAEGRMEAYRICLQISDTRQKLATPSSDHLSVVAWRFITNGDICTTNVLPVHDYILSQRNQCSLQHYPNILGKRLHPTGSSLRASSTF